mmetsp:Transcript_8890/g.26639  ORF Transcript_8890/g.26639 Transcript_8890/m.26639 type:complete len:179 (-) Transcript_8890:77-613(-)
MIADESSSGAAAGPSETTTMAMAPISSSSSAAAAVADSTFIQDDHESEDDDAPLLLGGPAGTPAEDKKRSRVAALRRKRRGGGGGGGTGDEGTSTKFTRARLHGMLKAGVALGAQLVTAHNLAYMMDLTRRMRRATMEGRYGAFARDFVREQYPGKGGGGEDPPEWVVDALTRAGIQL